jgi:hypothetical protein
MSYKATLLALDTLSESDRKLYKAAKIVDTEGKEVDGFAFDLEGLEDHPDAGALVRGKRRETQDRQVAEEALRKLRDEMRTMKEGEHDRLKGSRKKEEVDALEKSYEAKLLEKDTRNGELQASLHAHLVASVARDLASDLAVDREAIPALLPHILPRLAVEVEGKEARTRVLDAAGKPSAATVEDLTKELLASKSLARLVSGTKAKGGSAPGSNKARGSAPSTIDFNRSTSDVAADLEARARSEGKM